MTEPNILEAMLDPKALWNFCYGVYVVTSCDGDSHNGFIANTCFQVSANPPRIAVSVNKENLTHEYIEKSKVLGISVLDQETPMKFIGLFGFKSGRDVDKLSQVQSKKGTTGCRLVTENALSILEAKVVNQVDAGTHSVFIAEVVNGEVLRKGIPLTYEYYQTVKKGKAPKAAPTYKGPETESEQIPPMAPFGKKYICNICGYIYDPAIGDPESDIPPNTPFRDLPDNWKCPLCGVGKDKFSVAPE